MKYKGRRQSANIEDRRRGGTGKKVAVGGGIGAIAVAIIVMLLGGDPSEALQQLNQGQMQTTEQASGEFTAHEQELKEFVSVTLAYTEDVWDMLFKQMGRTYRKPKLVLFSGQVQSACGFSSAATGPFYCPGDDKVYIDLQFLEQMQKRLGANGDFAIAYIIAHEVGHHVQNQLGIMDQVNAKRGRIPETEFNKYMVRLELQADFLAGVWAHHAQKMFKMLEKGDIQEAMNAANSVGDDRIQKKSRGYIVPDSFTHGTSEQRMRWFNTGLKTGDLNKGDTFGARNL